MRRRKAVTTAMIALALKNRRNWHQAMYLCAVVKITSQSAKSIINNGGVLENEVLDEDDNTSKDIGLIFSSSSRQRNMGGP